MNLLVCDTASALCFNNQWTHPVWGGIKDPEIWPISSSTLLSNITQIKKGKIEYLSFTAYAVQTHPSHYILCHMYVHNGERMEYQRIWNDVKNTNKPLHQIVRKQENQVKKRFSKRIMHDSTFKNTLDTYVNLRIFLNLMIWILWKTQVEEQHTSNLSNFYGSTARIKLCIWK